LAIKRFVAIVVASVACLSFGGIAAQASTPVSGSGTFQVTFVPTGVETAGGNTFLTFTFTEKSSGFLTGTRVGEGSLVIHPDGTLNARGSGVFTGTVAGSAPGTAIFTSEVAGTFSATSGELLAGDGTEGLAGLQGTAVFTGSATGPTTLAGTYTAQVQFVTSS
jgi:hypothetical protein